MSSERTYYSEINLWRGIIVVLVVLAHSVNSTAYPSLLGFIHSYIYIFHMSALFLISGFLAYKIRLTSNKIERITFLKNKSIRLLIPYLFCTLASVILKLFFSEYAKNPLEINKIPMNILLGIDNPNGGIWYIYILFILSVIAIVSSRCNIKIILGVTLLLKVYSLSCASNVDIPLLSLISKYSIYYFLGIYIFKHYENIKYKIKSTLTIKYLLICELTLSFIISYFNIYYLNNQYLDFLLSLINIYISFKLAFSLKNNLILEVCGRKAMSIYIIGYYIQQSVYVILGKLLGIEYQFYWILMFIIPIIGYILIDEYIIKKSRLLRFLVLGEKNKLIIT